MDDLTLHCNHLKCREKLLDCGVVTTCCHIFCENCAHDLGLSSNGVGSRQCPACKTSLNNPDDAVITTLKPPEEWKTIVLSGLNPATIMECAARGLAFWSYQANQETKYQMYLGQSFTDRYEALREDTNRIFNEANKEILKSQEKHKGLLEEREDLIRANNELQKAYKEQSKSFAETRKLYNAMKAREMAVQVQDAAEEDAGHALMNAAANRFADRSNSGLGGRAGHSLSHIPMRREGVEYLHSRDQSGGSGRVGDAGGRFMHDLHSLNQGLRSSERSNSHTDKLSAGTVPLTTPSGLRTRLPVLHRTGSAAASPFVRQPLRTVNANTSTRFDHNQAASLRQKAAGRQTPILSRPNPMFPANFR